MQTTVADQIIQVIEYLGQKFGIAIDWSAENVLPLAQTLMERIARWCIAENVFFVALSLVGLIVGIIIFSISAQKLPKLDSYDEDEHEYRATLYIGGIIIFVIIGIAGAIGLCVNTYHLVQSICFPELAVFEYIQSFMGK
ncbi:MAG: hypothetical protein J6D42_11720 [Clostridia bacterium]|nr:hypothetical protein [Clostridia bacterium]